MPIVTASRMGVAIRIMVRYGLGLVLSAVLSGEGTVGGFSSPEGASP